MANKRTTKGKQSMYNIKYKTTKTKYLLRVLAATQCVFLAYLKQGNGWKNKINSVCLHSSKNNVLGVYCVEKKQKLAELG